MNIRPLHLRLTAMAVISVIFLCLTSCGDDKVVSPSESNTPGGNHSGSSDNTSATFDASLLIGSWKTTFIGNDYEIFTFNTDKTFSQKGYVNGGDFEDTGTWNLNSNTKVLTLTYSDGASQEGEIVRLTATELEVFNSVYLRNSSGDGGNGGNGGNGDSGVSQDTNRGPVATSFRGGGTQNNPYIISDASELRKLSDDCSTGMTYRGEYFKMTADITINRNVLLPNGDLNGDGKNFERWIPIGMDRDHPFCGTFDGNGHTISGLYVDSSVDKKPAGLFSYLAGTVQSLTVKDSYIGVGSPAWGSGSICGRTVSFSSSGYNYKASIKNCTNYSHIINKLWGAGGIVGDGAESHVVDRCINYGIIENRSAGAGGIIGRLGGIVSITNCVNYGVVYGWFAAGIAWVGLATTGTVCNLANFGDIYDQHDDADATYAISSGIFVWAPKTINNCVNYGTVHFPEGLGYGLFNETDNSSYNSLSSTQRNYYLETSCSKGYKYGGSGRTCISMTSNEMKQQAFLDELNKNAAALGSNYSRWKFGKNGYPTLEIVNE